ncbi:unnamed protein product [Brassica rapa subsp. trilocularis]
MQTCSLMILMCFLSSDTTVFVNYDLLILFSTQPRLLKLYKETVLEIALESVSESVETTPGHNRRPTRGSEDTASDDRQGSSVSADELLVLTKQYSSELLQTEMERTSRNYRGSQSSGSPIHARPRQR